MPAGHRTKAELAAQGKRREVRSITMLGDVIAPEADPKWHAKAADWYASLSESGQSKQYEPSDWAKAVFIADMLSSLLADGRGPIATPGRVATFKVLLSAMATL